MIKNFLLAFIPLFVAIDALGLMPVFFGLTEGMSKKQKSRIIVQSTLTAATVAVIFILVGKLLFKFLGITMEDFMIAGGAILFCISITDLINTERTRKLSADNLGSVPLGVPLLVGPAVLTTSLILVSQHGITPTILSVLANILIAAVILKQSHHLIKIFGNAGSKTMSKVMSLLLAAIAVMLIRKGIQGFIH
ncbi:MAG: MarC family protein [Planctomycetaceae bacterium]|nr:MarC family protein [Planctomycetaceae bacterium]